MKIFKILFLSLVLLLLGGCGNKVAFKPKEPLANSALVYIYVISELG
ncbi:MAG: hypothetical protein GXO30_02745, partial [Epsilonproteobacteria bacterium]|nr:hypothetical protein [Campylobacterota bacterium]